ncbi:MAG TPA: methylated-DNA--[protein]-cysteine S-methyltransferase [Pseudonocardiaceae bacterium]
MELTLPPQPTVTTTHHTPIGNLTLAATEQGLVSSSFASPDQVRRRLTAQAVAPGNSPAAQAWLDVAQAELDAYFAGTLRSFTIPVDLSPTGDFDRSVLTALRQVGYGSTTTYGRIAAELGLPREDARKVGGALARNPVPVVLPCHRVVGADGALVGFAGGLVAKRWLLDLESDQPQLALDLAG